MSRVWPTQTNSDERTVRGVTKELQMAFNSNIKTRFDIQVAVNDFYAQKAFGVYRGFVQLFTIKRREPRPPELPTEFDLAIPSLLRQEVYLKDGTN